MYTHVYVPLDNSDHSNAAMDLAVRIAAAAGARCTGSHVYAARMHDYRFKQMEYTLPDEYQDEAELLRQRRIHDSLITTGLQLISDSYTDVMRYRCLETDVAFEARAIDGKNWQAIVADVADPDQGVDLVVMGALGMGAVKESRLGSVTERVVRRLRTDVMVVREAVGASAEEEDGRRRPIVVGIDGSPQSFGGLCTALELGRLTGRPVEAVAVYDPYLHYAVFNSIVDVLSEKASKVFRFKEQEALHEEIIDSGLAKIYESHLAVARATAAEAGVDLPITLLDGKAFEQILRHCRERSPWLLVVGRIGVHSDAEMDLGSATEQLLRLAPCNLLVSSRVHVPPIEVRADTAVTWTPEAELRIERIPAAARGIARTAVLRWCLERGHSVVSSGDVDAAVEELMPFQRVMRRLGEVAATLDDAERAMRDEPDVERARAVCSTCAYASSAAAPVVCPVCGGPGTGFERIDEAALVGAVAVEGEAAETAFDGRKLPWTAEARRLLHELPAGYLRRRVKAIIEKTARSRRLPAITVEIVEPVVRPELDALDGRAGPHRAPIAASSGGVGPGAATARGRRLAWSLQAESRLERIPDGFLRNLAVEQVERIALAVGAERVGELHVEAGIAEARARMQAALAPARADAADVAAGAACPVSGTGAVAEPAPAAAGCPVRQGAESAPAAAEAGPTPAADTPAGSASACPVTHGGSGSPPTPSPTAVADVLARVAETNRRSGKFDAERATAMTARAAEERARLRGLNEVTAGFVESLGKKLGYGHPASPLTHEHRFEWSEEALARLEQVPDFCREMVRWRCEWFAAKKGMGTVITVDVVEGKLAAWGQVSEQIEQKGPALLWTEAARARLERIPASVRGEVMQAIEGNARSDGADRVDEAAIARMIERWQASGDFHQGRFGFRA